MKSLRILFALSTLLFVGCASNPMQVAQDQTVEKPGANEAQVVFLRSSFVGSAISASLYEVTDGKTEFVGVINNGTKIAYDTTPGKHTFMVVSEAADFLEANLEGGKTYYAIVTPRMGAWKARFSVWPIRNGNGGQFNTASSDFDSWVNGTKLVVNSPESRQWFEKNKASITAKQKDYWEVWQQKSAADMEERTLKPEDGM